MMLERVTERLCSARSFHPPADIDTRYPKFLPRKCYSAHLFVITALALAIAQGSRGPGGEHSTEAFYLLHLTSALPSTLAVITSIYCHFNDVSYLRHLTYSKLTSALPSLYCSVQYSKKPGMHCSTTQTLRYITL